jgi:lantibiotic biosynthesis protein
MGVVAEKYQVSAFRVTSQVLVRCTGLPLEALTGLNSPALLLRCVVLEEIEDKALRLAHRNSEELHRFIGTGTAAGLRNVLLEFRRDLFNGRSITEAKWLRVIEACPAPLAESLLVMKGTREEIARRQAEFEASYDETLAATRAHLHAWADDKDFVAGLILSAPSLVDSLPRLFAAKRTGSREAQIERGLLKYFTRACAKTTPFSRFCVILAGHLAEAKNGEGMTSFGVVGALRPMRSKLRLNKGFFGALASHLRGHPEIRRHLALELNPTLERRDDQLCFLAAVRGREVFQQLELDDALLLVLDVIRTKRGASIADLAHALSVAVDLETDAAEAEEYLNGLIGIGLLRMSCGVPEQEPEWDLALRSTLSADDLAEIPHVQQVDGLLRELRDYLSAYEQAEPGQRRLILSRLRERIQEAQSTLAVRVHWRVDAPILEDATAFGSVVIQRSSGLRRATETIEEYVRLVSAIAWPRAEQRNMYHYYATAHQDRDGLQVPALRFFEQYYREHFREHLERQNRPRAEGEPRYDAFNPFSLPEVEKIRATQNALSGFLIDRWRDAPDASEINVDLEALSDVLAPAQDFQYPVGSVSLFGQYWREAESGREGFVLPNGSLHTGYGKYFSRFLYLLDPQFTVAVQEENRRFADVMLAEICGDADFNANLHPPLVPWELEYPTSDGGHAGHSLNISDLVVAPSTQYPGTLELRHRQSGVRVEPVDLGFLNPNMRPALFQFLSRFNGFLNFALPLPDRIPEQRATAPEADAVPSPAVPNPGAVAPVVVPPS